MLGNVATLNDDPDLLKNDITSDVSWLYDYNFETKAQLTMEVFRRAKTEKSTLNLVKCKGFVHCFLRLQGASWITATRHGVNKEYYFEVMRRLREGIRQKSTEL